MMWIRDFLPQASPPRKTDITYNSGYILLWRWKNAFYSCTRTCDLPVRESTQHIDGGHLMLGSILETITRSALAQKTAKNIVLLCTLALCSLFHPLLVTNAYPQAIVLEIQGSINPAVSEYVKNGMEKAVSANGSLLILEMDTPGGLDRSMRDIIQLILGSSIPVVTYVAPEGARAASAGTYILYGSHVAAMSPATNLGAATPVSIGGMPDSRKPPGEKKDKEEPATDHESTMKRKVINDASAYIKALAEKQGRNAEWAVRAVKEAVSLSAQEALEMQVIEFVAVDLDDLLDQLDGHEVILDSKPYVIETTSIKTHRLKPSWRFKVLSVISDPNVAYFLLLLGFYGLVYELANPGVFLPGVAGAISLLLAFYAFQILPVNYSGLALIVLGMALMISEAFVPSFGALGIGGIIAFSVGSLILMDDEGLKISLSVITATTALSVCVMVLLMGRLFSIRKKKIVTGDEAIAGMTGEALEDFVGEGRIEFQGELWLAKSSDIIKRGEKVKIISRSGLKLKVQSLREGQ